MVPSFRIVHSHDPVPHIPVSTTQYTTQIDESLVSHRIHLVLTIKGGAMEEDRLSGRVLLSGQAHLADAEFLLVVVWV